MLVAKSLALAALSLAPGVSARAEPQPGPLAVDAASAEAVAVSSPSEEGAAAKKAAPVTEGAIEAAAPGSDSDFWMRGGKHFAEKKLTSTKKIGWTDRILVSSNAYDANNDKVLIRPVKYYSPAFTPNMTKVDSDHKPVVQILELWGNTRYVF